jgi:hypothetical protein
MLMSVFSSGCAGQEPSDREIAAVMEGIYRGERPPGIPDNWVGSKTKEPGGFRWDDPQDAGNSVRFLRGNPDDPNPAHREPFVIDVRGGKVRDVNGDAIEDEADAAEALTHE